MTRRYYVNAWMHEGPFVVTRSGRWHPTGTRRAKAATRRARRWARRWRRMHRIYTRAIVAELAYENVFFKTLKRLSSVHDEIMYEVRQEDVPPSPEGA